MRPRSWLNDEPGLTSLLRESVVLVGAGVRKPWLSLLTALVLASITVCAIVLLRGAYAPRYVMRVVEMDRDPATAPRPRRQLSEYVRAAVFTGPALERVMAEHGLYPGLARKNTQAAIESFREDIEVESYQNYFVEERDPHGAPRSARLAISFKSKDRAQALAVTRELGRLVVDEERKLRRRQAERAVRDADIVLDRARRSLNERRRSVLDRQLEIESVSEPDPMRQVELVSSLGSLDAREKQVEVAEKRKSQLELALAAEQRGVGLYFEVVDDGELPIATVSSTRPLMRSALTIFLVSLPMVALGVGAFTRRERGAA